MATFEAWDVIKVPFPYTNRPVQQRRPALVAAVYDETGSPALLWVLMITSVTHRGWNGDVEISDLAAAGLSAASVVRTAKVATIEQRDAERIGRVVPIDQAAVRTWMMGLLEPIYSGARK
jgi:mRNA interferase MazF